jgi:uncharacterized surface protein with fasciclin (FAS1) repeats
MNFINNKKRIVMKNTGLSIKQSPNLPSLKDLAGLNGLSLNLTGFFNLLGFTLLLGMAALLSSCEKEMDGQIYRVYDEKMIDEIMEEQQLTGFLSVVEKAGLTGTIHAYGTYTLFVPTNEALNNYLQTLGKNGVDALTKEEADALVKYHLVRDTLATTDFVDGRLASPNFLKKYLTTKSEAEGSRIYQRVNRQARIVVENLRGANGLLHVIDKVLTPPERSITDAVRALPDAEFSLIKTLFEQSGWADSLSVEREDHWFTFFVQDNKAFADAGVTTVDDLLAQLHESTPDIEDESELIRNYIGYHGVNSLMYVVDLLSVSSLNTLVPKQIITFKRNQDVILLNELIQDTFNEPGVPLVRSSEYSDLSCSNGVMHQINGNIQIKNRTAYRIYWDIAEQPEIMALKNFRKQGTSVKFKPGELSEITWGGKAPGEIEYYCGGYSNVLDEKFQYVYGDYLRFGLRTVTTQWMELKTPVLVEGKYKVWLCYRRELQQKLKTIFKQEGYDDQVLPYVFNMEDYMPNPDEDGSSHELIEIDGWKQYNAKKFNSVVISHLLGIIDVQTSGRHILRLEATIEGKGGQDLGSWDMIQFIPIDDDQLYPRVDIKGNWFTKDMPVCEAFPPDCDTAE